MEEVCPWCGQPSDRGRLKNRTFLVKKQIYSKVTLMLKTENLFSQCPISGFVNTCVCGYRYVWSGFIVLVGIYLNIYSKNRVQWDARFKDLLLRIFPRPHRLVALQNLHHVVQLLHIYTSHLLLVTWWISLEKFAEEFSTNCYTVSFLTVQCYSRSAAGVALNKSLMAWPVRRLSVISHF